MKKKWKETNFKKYIMSKVKGGGGRGGSTGGWGTSMQTLHEDFEEVIDTGSISKIPTDNDSAER